MSAGKANLTLCRPPGTLKVSNSREKGRKTLVSERRPSSIGDLNMQNKLPPSNSSRFLKGSIEQQEDGIESVRTFFSFIQSSNKVLHGLNNA